MKRLDLYPIIQKQEIFWFFKEDPRKVVKLLADVKAGAEQECQRPWVKKKVEEISTYIGGSIKFEGVTLKCKGLLPSAPVIDIKGDLKVKKDENGYFINFPETEEEFEKMKGCIDAIDGQNRLRAFMDEFLKLNLKDKEIYEMVFFVFDSLSINEKRELFLITNEKHESMSKNLLRKMKKWLGLLEGDDERIFDIVSALNIENFSPIRGKVIIGENTIKNGWKEAQVSRIINKSNAFNKLKELDEIKIGKVISNYLKAWEDSYDLNIKRDTTSIISKISGFRYIMYYFPVIYDALIEAKVQATKENFEKYILYTKEVTNMKNVFDIERNAFKGEGATLSLVHDHITQYNKLIKEKLNKFDPSEGI